MKEENFRKRYLVILADRKKARIFTIYLGKFEDRGEEFDVEDVPQKIKAVDGRQGKIERHIETHLKQHLQNVGREAMQYLVRNQVKQVDGIFIGTHKELFEEIKESLPPRLKHKILGEFVTEPSNAVGDVTAKVISVFGL